jgi:hypothetical protein
MIKSIVYKEWIKTRWFLLILTILGVLAVGNIFLKVQHYITFNEAHNYWYLVLFQNQQYFKGLRFIPLVIGLGIALVQYIPEITNKRIKLTFHLPVNENRALVMMLAYGVVVLLLCYALLIIMFILLSQHFFGAEIVRAALISITPWFLAGMAAYFLAALVVMEAIWKYRVAYFLAASAFILFFFERGMAGAYAPLNWKLAVLTLLVSLSMTFSAYRFRKGEM